MVWGPQNWEGPKILKTHLYKPTFGQWSLKYTIKKKFPAHHQQQPTSNNSCPPTGFNYPRFFFSLSKKISFSYYKSTIVNKYSWSTYFLNWAISLTTNLQSVEESFRIDYFLFIIDQAISSIEQRFEQFHIYEELFGFLFSFEKLKSFDNDSLKDKCLCLESALTYKNSIDIDGLDLFSELKVLREVIQTEENKNTPVDILNYIKKLKSFPNACIAYRILLTIPITVTSAERTFSKLKLIKSYLRSTMSQERLCGLAILSIEKNVLEKIDYKNLISNFASKRARKMKF